MISSPTLPSVQDYERSRHEHRLLKSASSHQSSRPDPMAPKGSIDHGFEWSIKCRSGLKAEILRI